MLPRAHRLTRSADFATTVRRGQRFGTRSLVVHFRTQDADAPAQVGFIVSKAVGGAVVRNRVKRQLRHVMADRVERLPSGSCLVVRALSGASSVTSPELVRDVDRALARVLDRPSSRGHGAR